MTSNSDEAEKIMNDYFNEVLDCYDAVLEYFKGDKSRTDLWFDTPNPNFGGTTPKILIKLGKADKLKAFIKAAKEGY